MLKAALSGGPTLTQNSDKSEPAIAPVGPKRGSLGPTMCRHADCIAARRRMWRDAEHREAVKLAARPTVAGMLKVLGAGVVSEILERTGAQVECLRVAS